MVDITQSLGLTAIGFGNFEGAGVIQSHRNLIADDMTQVDFTLGKGPRFTGCIQTQATDGEVMKNVAGYDVARLMTGAMGTLGVLLDISLKILPQPANEVTLGLTMSPDEALQAMNHWAGQPVPLSAAVHDGSSLMLRLSGAASAVAHAQQLIGGELLPNSGDYWRSIREHTHPFFNDTRPLWRLSLVPAHPPLKLEGDTLLDWGGAQRWMLSNESPKAIRHAVEEAGGHATLFRPHEINADIFQPLPGSLKQLHQRLKHAFDPDGILNHGRMYPDM